MTVTKANYNILKKAAILGGLYIQEVEKAITETEQAEKEHNQKMIVYISEKRKTNKKYCH